MIEHDPEATLYAIMSLISLFGLAVLVLLYLDYWRDKRELELMAKRDEGWDECAGITAKVKSDFADTDFHIPWYRRWFPFFPVWDHDHKFRCFLFQLWDCSVTHHSLPKAQWLDLLEHNHRKWWQPKYIGFVFWY